MDLVEQLERLAALRKDGSLTDAEYVDAKRRLLGGDGAGGGQGGTEAASEAPQTEAPDPPSGSDDPYLSEEEFLANFASLDPHRESVEPGLRFLYEQIRDGDLAEDEIYVLGPATGIEGVPPGDGLLVLSANGLVFVVPGGEPAFAVEYRAMSGARCATVKPGLWIEAGGEFVHLRLADPDLAEQIAGCLVDHTASDQWDSLPAYANPSYMQSRFAFPVISDEPGRRRSTPHGRAKNQPPPPIGLPSGGSSPSSSRGTNGVPYGAPYPKPAVVPSPRPRMSAGGIVAIVLGSIVLVILALGFVFAASTASGPVKPLTSTGSAINGVVPFFWFGRSKLRNLSIPHLIDPPEPPS